MARSRSYMGVSMFMLKMIAILSMLSSHIAIVFYKKIPSDTLLWMHYFGRLAFPIFAFSIANGWKHTHSKLFYMIRILIMAAVSQIPYALALYGASFGNIKSFFLNAPLNIGFTFLLAILSLLIFDMLRKMDFPKLVATIVAALPAIAFEYLTPFHVDYGYAGVILILIMYATHGDLPTMFLSSSAVFLWMCASFKGLTMTASLDVFLCYVTALVLLSLYSGKKGAGAKYIFYIFYPLHLIVLYLLKGII